MNPVAYIDEQLKELHKTRVKLSLFPKSNIEKDQKYVSVRNDTCC